MRHRKIRCDYNCFSHTCKNKYSMFLPIKKGFVDFRAEFWYNEPEGSVKMKSIILKFRKRYCCPQSGRRSKRLIGVFHEKTYRYFHIAVFKLHLSC